MLKGAIARQVLGPVEVPQQGQLGPPPTEPTHPRAGDVRDRGRTPGDALEQCGLRPAQAEQSIAAVLGGADHRIRPLQRLDCQLQIGAIKPGEIRADEQDISRARQRVGGRERHSRSQVTATLALEIQARPREVLEGGMGGVRLAPKLERGKLRGHDPIDGNRKKLAREGGGPLRAQHRDKPRLDPAGHWGLREHQDAGSRKPHERCRLRRRVASKASFNARRPDNTAAPAGEGRPPTSTPPAATTSTGWCARPRHAPNGGWRQPRSLPGRPASLFALDAC